MHENSKGEKRRKAFVDLRAYLRLTYVRPASHRKLTQCSVNPDQTEEQVNTSLLLELSCASVEYRDLHCSFKCKYTWFSLEHLWQD